MPELLFEGDDFDVEDCDSLSRVTFSNQTAQLAISPRWLAIDLLARFSTIRTNRVASILYIPWISRALGRVDF
jgi:hypothetical protein